jgi:hypothetical protein
VLAAGGYNTSIQCGVHPRAESAAALFAPESDGFTATGTLSARRYMHTATVLPDDTVVVIGGEQRNVAPFPGRCHLHIVVLSSAEVFK